MDRNESFISVRVYCLGAEGRALAFTAVMAIGDCNSYGASNLIEMPVHRRLFG